MMKRAAIVCLILSLLISCSCRKRAKEPEAGAASAPRVTVRQASWREPPMTSESLRLAWNESAAELFDIRWSSDRQRPWKIDIEAGDISMPSSRRARFGQPASGPLSATPELIRAIDL
ncbi:MAG TPA: hypothetical protein PLZ86_09780, partial [bacterium]|nr:hypothetical protein [bacterium]